MHKIAHMGLPESSGIEDRLASDETSGGLGGLLDEWGNLEAHASRLTAYVETEGGMRSAAPDLQAKLDQLMCDVEARQRDLLREIADQKAGNQGDMLAKLKVWKSVVCPTPDDEAYLEPASRLVLSLLDDLSENLS